MRDLPDKTYFQKPASVQNKKMAYAVDGKTIKSTYVKHLGRLRIPTLFPQLLEEVCAIDGETY